MDDNPFCRGSEIQDFREATELFLASTSQFMADSHQYHEDQRKQMEEIKKQLQQLTEAVRNSSNQNPSPEILNVEKPQKQRDTTPELKYNEDQIGKEVDDRTLLIKIHFEIYSISWEVLDQIFSRFGGVEYLEVFVFGGEYHSKIRFRNKESTIGAFDSLNHRDIYNGCCQLELFWASSVESSSSEQEIAEQSHEIDEDADVTLNLAFDDSRAKCIDDNEEIEAPIEEPSHEIIELKESKPEPVEGSDQHYSANEFSNCSVALNPYECEYSNSLVVCSPSSNLNLDLEIKSLSKVLDSSENLGTDTHASKVLEGMPERNFVLFGFSAELEHKELTGLYDTLFARESSLVFVFDPGGFCILLVSKKCYAENLEAVELVDAGGIMVFDPGGGVHMLVNGIFCVKSPFAMLLVDRLILVFDPGGINEHCPCRLSDSLG